MSVLGNFARAASAAAVASVFAVSAHADATIQYAGGQFTTFTGFDWSSNATAFTTGFTPVTGDNFTLTFFSYAAALQSPNTVPSGMDLIANGGGANSTGFNWTVVATLNETAFFCNGTGTVCQFDILAGSTFDVYYNAAFDANHTAGSLGTGFTNGTKIISGTLRTTSLGGGGLFGLSPGGGTGTASIIGDITYTNSAFVAPDLLGTTVGTQLNLGSLVTDWTNPGGYNNVAWTGAADQIVFQADGNQTFTTVPVPEPGALALVAVALAGMGVVTGLKRKNS